MGIRTRVFARFYDRSMDATERAGLAAMRGSLLDGAHGDVVELGAGTGLNLAHYGPDVRTLTLVEPDPSMRRRLEPLARRTTPVATVVDASAEHLPLDDHSVDTVVSTLVLCGVDDVGRALAEVQRVLRPDGHLLVIEHVRSDDPEVARRQDRLDWLQHMFAGCHCNRSTGRTLAAAGFDTTGIVRTTLPRAPAIVSPLLVGTAHVPPGAT